MSPPPAGAKTSSGFSDSVNAFIGAAVKLLLVILGVFVVVVLVFRFVSGEPLMGYQDPRAQNVLRGQNPGVPQRYGPTVSKAGEPTVVTSTPCTAHGRKGNRGQDDLGRWGCVLR